MRLCIGKGLLFVIKNDLHIDEVLGLSIARVDHFLLRGGFI